MSERPLHILFAPSLREGPWRQAITAAAQAKGLSVGVWGGEPADVVLVDHLEPDQLDGLTPSEWVVLGDAPEAGLTAYGDAYQEFPPAAHAWMAASKRLAMAATLVERGAPVLGMPAMALGLPRLGLVSQTITGIPEDNAGPTAPVLAMYQRLPPLMGARAVWSADRFNYPLRDDPLGGTPRMDLTGRARTLMFGPYVWLPPGAWRATLKIMVDPEGGEVPLWFDWGCGEDVATVREMIDQAGFYSLTLDQVWTRPGAAQLRIVLSQAVFQGRMEVLDCQIERIEPPAPAEADSL